jgi:hypothetical protein
MLATIRIQETENLLWSHNSINIVRSPTRITRSSEFLIDVIVTNKDNSELGVSVADLGFSDHLAQVIKINTGEGNRRNKIVLRRHLTNNNNNNNDNNNTTDTTKHLIFFNTATHICLVRSTSWYI